MAKEQVLGFKPAPRLEQVDDEHAERVQDCEHRHQSCDDSASRHESQAGWNFRKGQARILHQESSWLTSAKPCPASPDATALTFTATLMARGSAVAPYHVPCRGIASRGCGTTATRMWF